MGISKTGDCGKFDRFPGSFNNPDTMAVENVFGKDKNGGNQHYMISPPPLSNNGFLPSKAIFHQLNHIFTFSLSFRIFPFLPNDKFLDWSELKVFADDKEKNVNFSLWTCVKFVIRYRVNFLPNEKFLDWSKLKVLADDKEKKCD